jgi:hypothetical protein
MVIADCLLRGLLRRPLVWQLPIKTYNSFLFDVVAENLGVKRYLSTAELRDEDEPGTISIRISLFAVMYWLGLVAAFVTMFLVPAALLTLLGRRITLGALLDIPILVTVLVDLLRLMLELVRVAAPFWFGVGGAAAPVPAAPLAAGAPAARAVAAQRWEFNEEDVRVLVQRLQEAQPLDAEEELRLRFRVQDEESDDDDPLRPRSPEPPPPPPTAIQRTVHLLVAVVAVCFAVGKGALGVAGSIAVRIVAGAVWTMGQRSPLTPHYGDSPGRVSSVTEAIADWSLQAFVNGTVFAALLSLVERKPRRTWRGLLLTAVVVASMHTACLSGWRLLLSISSIRRAFAPLLLEDSYEMFPVLFQSFYMAQHALILLVVVKHSSVRSALEKLGEQVRDELFLKSLRVYESTEGA